MTGGLRSLPERRRRSSRPGELGLRCGRVSRARRTIGRVLTERVGVGIGIELAVDRWAPAPGAVGGVPFVLVHGLASNARLWDGTAARLTALGHPVVTVDLRGHGRSSKPDDGYEVATVAGDLAEVIDHLRLDHPVVVGQSWGGNVALELAAGWPDRIRAIALVDGGWLEPRAIFPDWQACLQTLAPPRLVGRPLTEITGHLRSSHPDWPETGTRGMLANFEVRPDGTVAPWLTYERHLVVLRGLWDHRPSERYGAVPVPVLLIPADPSNGVGIERKRHDVEAAAAAISRSRVRWFVGDHDIHAQHPDELGDVLHAAATDGFFE
jgi:pimeloyl-ACP methyl ester carboxylesterase